MGRTARRVNTFLPFAYPVQRGDFFMHGFRRFLLRLALALGLIFAFSLWCWLRGQLLMI